MGINSIMETFKKNLDKENVSISTYSRLGSKSAKVLFASSSPIPLSKISRYIHDKSSNNLSIFTDSYLTYKDKRTGTCYASIIAYKPNDKGKNVPVKGNEDNFVHLKANSYINTKYKNIWSKKDTPDGEFFYRDEEEDVGQILSEVIDNEDFTKLTASTKSLTPNIEEGDFVEAFVLDSKNNPGKAVAKVEKIVKDQVNLNYNGVNFTVPKDAILTAITYTGEEPISWDQVIQFLKECYIPKEGHPEFESKLSEQKLPEV